MQKFLFGVLLLLWTPASLKAAAVQIPPAIKQQVAQIQDRFGAVLDQECPPGQCFSVGCKPSRFDTLDQTQSASLPGLEEAPVTDKPQYRLAAVLCEFAYEPSLSARDLGSIRQRVTQKVKTVGLSLAVTTRALQPKPVEIDNPSGAKALPPVPPWEQVFTRVLPFIPWFLSALLVTLLVMILLWCARRLGRGAKPAQGVHTRADDQATALTRDAAAPTPRMLLDRIAQLRGELMGDKRLVEMTLKKHFDEPSIGELCQFLRHFGPELLQPFKEKTEYRETLGLLSQAYSEAEFDDDPQASWRFLNHIERDMTAAKVRIDAQPLADDFNFLLTVQVDEFVGILRELTEEEAIAAVSYAPRTLRERFFAHANPAFTAKFVEHLTKVEKMPDAFVRQVAQKLRSIYLEKGDSLRTIRVDKIPLLEEALNALEPEKRRQLFTNLGRANPEFVAAVSPSMFLDDSLPYLPVDLLTEALLAVSPEEAAAYLASFPWGPETLLRVSSRLAETIRLHWPASPHESARAARQAREKIAAFVKRHHAQGTIDLRQLNARLVGEAP